MQNVVASNVGWDFDNAGWTGPNGVSSDQQGNPGSYKSNILWDLSWLQNNAANVAIVDFDHGVGTSAYSADPGIFHYMSEDEEGNYVGNYGAWQYEPWQAVYDNDIYTRVNQGEVTFA